MKYTFLMQSPLGTLRVITTDAALSGIDFVNQIDEIPGSAAEQVAILSIPVDEKETPLLAADQKSICMMKVSSIIEQFEKELASYFSGTLQVFTVPFAVETGTEFQKKVWQALLSIPYGETRTYGDLARSLGLTLGASRAVGNACGANPIPIIIPCHRVVAAGGSLGGYSGGLWRKARLLALEGAASIA
ncbi:methylated-DNA--[protein]-cysteine S-methyltransferase [Gracilinema caldarium]|uniref:Methylated-DNA--protein-cysteine methyltransferase n=1 Tax=Gracilinema caldarium (strain ATCC 51460 / DSM 7334 / H1) TaxID=744872 RepID=F8F3V4_GRAC1|nr:methylated-DNA--[protein]-cysteine S-methyltransferase [Gracilinema caldarium]AEJ20473.1 methylated-DNA/protein-cysteinemethyltransferase [Gracilinema caldarium DSM 7334]